MWVGLIVVCLSSLVDANNFPHPGSHHCGHMMEVAHMEIQHMSVALETYQFLFTTILITQPQDDNKNSPLENKGLE